MALGGDRLVARVCLAAALLAGCESLPGRPTESDRPIRPSQVKDFAQLYAQNCAGCHGAGGTLGAALPLDHPVYLALVDDASLRQVIARGVPGTAMPMFASSEGGFLTDEQIDILISAMRQRWGRPGVLAGAVPPPHTSTAPGDARRGADVYAASCQPCHGADGTSGPKAGSIVDGAYLALVSDQALRTLIIAGRPDLGHPDWRTYPQGPLTAEQVSDVVAWLVAKRSNLGGQRYARSSREDTGGGAEP